jgi:predicted O-methyltransferase YrrM
MTSFYDILPAAVTPDRGAYLAKVCREVRPAATVEVGMAWGLSTLWILKALLEQTDPAPHVVMDPFQRFGYHGAAVRALRDNGLEPMVEFYEEASIDVLERLAAEKRRFDFAFIDGDHSYEAVLCDFWLLDPLIRPGGVIVFDDVWAEGVQRVCLLAKDHLGYTMHSEHLDRDFGYRPLVRTYVKSDQPGLRQPSDLKRLAREFREARTRTLRATLLQLQQVQRRRRAQAFSHAGLAALGRGERAFARLNFYHSLRNRPFKLKNYVRLARTFLPLAVAHALSGNRVKDARRSRVPVSSEKRL